jgi:hypothetical protein
LETAPAEVSEETAAEAENVSHAYLVQCVAFRVEWSVDCRVSSVECRVSSVK